MLCGFLLALRCLTHVLSRMGRIVLGFPGLLSVLQLGLPFLVLLCALVVSLFGLLPVVVRMLRLRIAVIVLSMRGLVVLGLPGRVVLRLAWRIRLLLLLRSMMIVLRVRSVRILLCRVRCGNRLRRAGFRRRIAVVMMTSMVAVVAFVLAACGMRRRRWSCRLRRRSGRYGALWRRQRLRMMCSL
jgi:hypothetical protein